jgi:hypothetical protein
MRNLSFVLSTVLAGTVFCQECASAQSSYDKAKLLDLEVQHCKRIHLNAADWVSALAMLRISLDAICLCTMTQVVSRMTDADIQYMANHKGMWNQRVIGLFDSSRKGCAQTLAD